MKKNIKNYICPLCKTTDIKDFYQDLHRNYFQCNFCNLVFVPSEQFLSNEEEKSRYDLHQNKPYDERYRKFLNRIFIPLKNRLKPQSHGLDFGSGPGPTLYLMFEEIGHFMTIYDSFYAYKPSIFKKKYDFITATEVVEHLHNPREELDRLWNCLKPEGNIGIMTKLVIDRDAFINWHYKNDLTHVIFFSKSTFEWLKSYWKAEYTFVSKDAVIFLKTKV